LSTGPLQIFYIIAHNFFFVHSAQLNHFLFTMEATTTAGDEKHAIVPMKEGIPATTFSVMVLLFCGLPASGKSSLAKQVCEQVQQNK
jgi:hypothetical protein